MITVACVLRSGGIYTAEWVAKLQRGVARHLSAPHRFVCLSDVDVPCERIPLEYDWEALTADRPRRHDWRVAPRWWAKIELFRPGLFDGPVLYSDLDNLIVGPLDPIFDRSHSFTMADDPWVSSISGPRCSAVMAWQGDHSEIFNRFAAAPDEIAHRYDVEEPHRGRIGDQAFIEDTVKANTFREVCGSVVVSYKCDNLQTQRPVPPASIVMFHGLPKMNEIDTGWVKDAWQ